MDDELANPSRGSSRTSVWESECKDCRTELRYSSGAGERRDRAAERSVSPEPTFQYSGNSAQRLIERGNTRSDRCERHRRIHAQAVRALAVPYIDLRVIGEISNTKKPTGPLGGLGPLPTLHKEREETPVNLEKFEFGMSDADIVQILGGLVDRRIAVVEAGTGTGKSTFMPFRLMNPPKEACLRINDFGPIVVTEPRRAAATGVARFVGEELCFGHDSRSCDQHIGAGFPVGYQVSGERRWDSACDLIYVTDGTMINWVRDGQLSKIGMVIIDEAHERSENIDVILAQLRDKLRQYSHLRLIITSATLDKDFFISFFGGVEHVFHYSIPAKKSFGYGVPLFVGLQIDDPIIANGLPLADDLTFSGWLTEGPLDDKGRPENLQATTNELEKLRCVTEIPVTNWRKEMPEAVVRQVVAIAVGTDWGDILAFLPTNLVIQGVVERIITELGNRSTDFDVYPLLSTTPKTISEKAIAGRSRGDKRKIVVSSNLAETSLTVKGVRYVVDSGLICQAEWDPDLASGTLPTKPHSQSGLRQRWGRVGRDAPGWVFPLYTPDQFVALAKNTPPESALVNLETFYMKLISSGLDLDDALLPGSFVDQAVSLDQSGRDNIDIFRRESVRARRALALSGSIDQDGQLTEFGRELERFPGDGSSALALMLADQLACVHEVALALNVLGRGCLVGNKAECILRVDREWPTAWRIRAAQCHRALAIGCSDDLDVLLRVFSLWRAAKNPKAWCATWWVNEVAMRNVLSTVLETLSGFSAAMKKEADRPILTELGDKARAVLTRAMVSLRFLRIDGAAFRSEGTNPEEVRLGFGQLVDAGDRVLAFNRFRRPAPTDGPAHLPEISHLVRVLDWAELREPGSDDLGMDLLLRAADNSSTHEKEVSRISEVFAVAPVGSVLSLDIVGPAAEIVGFELLEAPFQLSLPTVNASARKELRLSGSGFDRDWDFRDSGLGEQPEEEADRTVIKAINLEHNDEVSPNSMVDLGVDASKPVEAAITRPRLTALPFLAASPVFGKISGLVVGYKALGDNRVAILIDQIASGCTVGDPARPTGLRPWQELEVEVAGLVRDHERDFLQLNRRDLQGRFYLDADNAGLNATDTQFARRLPPRALLKARVLPKLDGEISVTLLPSARKLLASMPADRSAQGERIPFYKSTVVEVSPDHATMELDYRDRSELLSHRFLIQRQDLEQAGLNDVGIGTNVLLSLKPDRAYRPRKPLKSPSGTVAEFIEKQSNHLEVRNGRIQAKAGDVPISVINGLIRAGGTADWSADVWNFYEDSLHLSVQSVVAAKPRASVEVPVRMLSLFDDRKRDFEEQYGVAIVALKAESCVGITGSSQAVVSAAVQGIGNLSKSPMLAAGLTDGAWKWLRQRQFENRAMLEARPGILYVWIHRDTACIVATNATVLENTLRELLKPVSGILNVETGKSRWLVGTNGNILRKLTSETLCWADNPDKGDRWDVRGPTKESVEAFFRGAAAVKNIGRVAAQIVDVKQIEWLPELPRPIRQAHVQNRDGLYVSFETDFDIEFFDQSPNEVLPQGDVTSGTTRADPTISLLKMGTDAPTSFVEPDEVIGSDPSPLEDTQDEAIDGQEYFVFEVVNETDEVASIAVVARESPVSTDFVATGWFNVEPRSTRQLGGFPRGNFYATAKGVDGSDWSGSDYETYVHPSKPFRRILRSEYRGEPGEAIASFYEFFVEVAVHEWTLAR